jgi:NAD(P)-dependent dehydrogenase (short-subunit alcohol dehydrogenase family)
VKGKVIAVTGAYGSLGKVVAAVAADRGAFVAAIDFAAAPPDGLAERLGPDAMLLGGVDLSSAEGAHAAIADVVTKFGRLDALVNIAGGFAWEKVEGGNASCWDRLFAINLKTALHASQAAIPHLLQSGAGRIVNVGAASAVKAAAGMGPYAVSKGAVHRLTESLAEELKNRGVTVNAVLPSIIDTPGNRAEMPGAAFDHWVAPTDLAAVILFLVSDEAKAVTGALLPVTGGV